MYRKILFFFGQTKKEYASYNTGEREYLCKLCGNQYCNARLNMKLEYFFLVNI